MGETDIDECIMILTETIHEQGEVVFSKENGVRSLLLTK